MAINNFSSPGKFKQATDFLRISKATFTKNLVFGVLVKLTFIFSQLIVIPLFIKTLGEQLYGEWIMISTIPNYIMLSDLGLTTAVSNQISAFNISQEFDKMDNLFKSTNYIIIKYGIVLILIFLTLFIFVDFKEILKIKILKIEECDFIIILLLVNVVLSLLFNFNISFFKVLNLYHENQKYYLLSSVLEIVSIVTVLWSGLNIMYIPIFNIISKIVVLKTSVKALKNYEIYKYGFSSDTNNLKLILPSTVNLTLYNLGFGLILQGNTFVVGKTFGSVEVVKFNTVRVLVNTIRSFMSILYMPKMPTYNILILNGKFKEVRLIFKKNIFLVLILGILIGLIIEVYYDNIFYLWLHRKLTISNSFILSMLIAGILHSLWNAMSMVPLSVNKSNNLLVFPALGLIGFIIQLLFLSYFDVNFTSGILLITDALMLSVMYFQVKKILYVKS